MTRADGAQEPHPGMSTDELRATLAREFPPYLLAHRMGAFIWDFTSDRLWLAPGALALFGIAPGGFDGRPATLRELMAPDPSPTLREHAAGGASAFGSYFRVLPRDASGPGAPHRWAYLHAQYERDADGTALRAVGLMRDAGAELGHAAEQATLAYEQSRQLQLVQAVTAELSKVLSVDDLVDYVTGRPFLDMFGAAGVALSVVDGDRRRMLAAAGLPEDLVRELRLVRLDSRLPVSDVIRSRTPLVLTREIICKDYPRIWPYFESSDLTIAFVIPLVSRDQPIGALSLHYKDKNEFRPEERNLLFAVASAFSQAVERIRLFDREHAMSVALQQSMLPTRVPEVPGVRLAVRYRPARAGHQVGGDWYDVIPLPGGAVALVVGDVQGHDVQAAAVMGQLRSALRAYITEGHTPAAAVARASRFLHDQDTDLIATCVCAYLDPVAGTCAMVRAGHPYPVVRSAGGASATLRIPGGLPLGMPASDAEPYPTAHLRLSPESMLLLCTDGLVESRGSDMDSGQRQICTLLDEGPEGLDAMVDHIIATIDERQGQEDDVVLLLVCLGGPPTSPPASA